MHNRASFKCPHIDIHFFGRILPGPQQPLQKEQSRGSMTVDHKTSEDI